MEEIKMALRTLETTTIRHRLGEGRSFYFVVPPLAGVVIGAADLRGRGVPGDPMELTRPALMTREWAKGLRACRRVGEKGINTALITMT